MFDVTTEEVEVKEVSQPSTYVIKTNTMLGASVLSFQRVPSGPNGEREVSYKGGGHQYHPGKLNHTLFLSLKDVAESC